VLLQPSKPIIVDVTESMIPETTTAHVVLDLLLGSLGLTALLVIGALLLGLVLGAVFIAFRRTWPDNAFNGDSSDEAQLHLNAR
jgi:hypothetical protein